MSKGTNYPTKCHCGNEFASHRAETKVILYCGACGNEEEHKAPRKVPEPPQRRAPQSHSTLFAALDRSAQKKTKKKGKGRNTPSHAKGYVNTRTH